MKKIICIIFIFSASFFNNQIFSMDQESPEEILKTKGGTPSPAHPSSAYAEIVTMPQHIPSHIISEDVYYVEKATAILTFLIKEAPAQKKSIQEMISKTEEKIFSKDTPIKNKLNEITEIEKIIESWHKNIRASLKNISDKMWSITSSITSMFYTQPNYTEISNRIYSELDIEQTLNMNQDELTKLFKDLLEQRLTEKKYTPKTSYLYTAAQKLAETFETNYRKIIEPTVSALKDKIENEVWEETHKTISQEEKLKKAGEKLKEKLEKLKKVAPEKATQEKKE